jgi:hypothetical protein
MNHLIVQFRFSIKRLVNLRLNALSLWTVWENVQIIL